MKMHTFSLAGIQIVFTCLILMTAARQAWSAATVSVFESAGNVVVSGSGSFNLAALTAEGGGEVNSSLNPALATFVVGSGFHESYGNVSGPNNFGFGGLVFGSSSTGSPFGVLQNGFGGFFLIVPRFYASGTPLDSSATYTGQSFGSMGLPHGTHNWTWGSGADADSLTMHLIPEPSALALLGIGAGVVATTGGRKRSVPRD